MEVHLIHVGVHNLFIETIIIPEELSHLGLRERKKRKKEEENKLKQVRHFFSSILQCSINKVKFQQLTYLTPGENQFQHSNVQCVDITLSFGG